LEGLDSLVAGALGGFCLGIGRLVVTIVGQSLHHPHAARFGQLVASHILVALVFALLGGAVSWALTGRAGDFMQGVTALSTLILLAGGLVQTSEGGQKGD
jgi:hypothetical protein